MIWICKNCWHSLENCDCVKEATECEYCSNTATVTHKNISGNIVKLCKSCKETQTKV